MKKSFGQWDNLFSWYLDFAERQAEREQVMTMSDWAEHLERILTTVSYTHLTLPTTPYV